jgi:hypothetical protein
MGLDVDLHDLGAAVVFVGELVQEGADHLAGTAPGRPEVDEDRDVGLQHVGIEIGVGGMDDLVAHFGSPEGCGRTRGVQGGGGGRQGRPGRGRKGHRLLHCGLASPASRGTPRAERHVESMR